MARRSLIIRKARMAFLAIVIIASADVCDSEMRFTLTASWDPAGDGWILSMKIVKIVKLRLHMSGVLALNECRGFDFWFRRQVTKGSGIQRRLFKHRTSLEFCGGIKTAFFWWLKQMLRMFASVSKNYVIIKLSSIFYVGLWRGKGKCLETVVLEGSTAKPKS